MQSLADKYIAVTDVIGIASYTIGSICLDWVRRLLQFRRVPEACSRGRPATSFVYSIFPERYVHEPTPPEIVPDDSDSEDEEETGRPEAPKDLPAATRRIAALQRKLEQSKQDLVYYRGFVSERLNLAGLADELKEPTAASTSTHAAVPLRDDDSHYFQSYAENGQQRSLSDTRFVFIPVYRHPLRHDFGQGSHRDLREVHSLQPRCLP